MHQVLLSVQKQANTQGGKRQQSQKWDRNKAKKVDVFGGAGNARDAAGESLRNDSPLDQRMVELKQPADTHQGCGIVEPLVFTTDDADADDRHQWIHQNTGVPAQITRRKVQDIGKVEAYYHREQGDSPGDVVGGAGNKLHHPLY